MHLFYQTHISGKTIYLEENESKHCIRVLRLKLNDEVWVTDGDGTMNKTQISDDNPKAWVLTIHETIKKCGDRPYKLHIAISPLQHPDRLEWFLEKATEAGIDEITPILCEHTEKKHVNSERLQKVLIAAMKQSLKAKLPTLNKIIKFSDFVKQEHDGLKGIAYCHDNRLHITEWYKTNSNCLILIGPEGDFSEAEIEMATKMGFIGITLGNSRLRTETAALSACIAVNLINKF
jgi:16S rRNA (uracil1498-N3)-methyltransferase